MKVAVSGAGGRMGGLVAETIRSAPDLELGGLYDSKAIPDQGVSTDTEVVRGSDVVVEFTVPEAVMGNLERWRSMGVHAVVGTSGFAEDRLEQLRRNWGSGPPNCLIAPNFSVGAVLMMRFAELAAPHFKAAEVIELHHDHKADAPSGTALNTAARISAAKPDQVRAVESTEIIDGARGADVGGVAIHGVRLPGLLAHQEVLLGNDGELLTIRHDTTDRISFMSGVLLAVRKVGTLPGVTVGIESLLGL
jgi:4-hydroxy-tetrahydrodipicolinate reductase